MPASGFRYRSVRERKRPVDRSRSCRTGPMPRSGIRIRVEDLGVGCESKEPLLSQPAKAERPGRQAVEPTLGVKVVEMDVERQGRPQINVGQEHRPLPGTPQRWPVNRRLPGCLDL